MLLNLQKGISKVLALKQQPEEWQPQRQHHWWDAWKQVRDQGLVQPLERDRKGS